MSSATPSTGVPLGPSCRFDHAGPAGGRDGEAGRLPPGIDQDEEVVVEHRRAVGRPVGLVGSVEVDGHGQSAAVGSVGAGHRGAGHSGVRRLTPAERARPRSRMVESAGAGQAAKIVERAARAEYPGPRRPTGWWLERAPLQAFPGPGDTSPGTRGNRGIERWRRQPAGGHPGTGGMGRPRRR